MKKAIPTMMIGVAITMFSFAVPSHAGTIDQVKDKVVEIKKDTGTIKNKINGMLGQLQLLVADTFGIRTMMDPLFQMRQMFDELGIDPGELMDSIPREDVQNMIEEMRAERDARQQALTEDVEPFRAELLEVLESINMLVAEGNAVPQISPLQTLVEQAPKPVMVALRTILSPVFEPLKASVYNAKTSLVELHELGAFDLMAMSYPIAFNATEMHSNATGPGYKTVVDLTLDEKLHFICPAVGNIKPLSFKLWQNIVAVDEILAEIARAESQTNNQEKATTIEGQIHGYLKFIEFSPFKKVAEGLGNVKWQLERYKMRLGHIKEILNWGREFGGCDAVVEWIDEEPLA